MPINSNAFRFGLGVQGCCTQQPQCPDQFGCPAGMCPDFEIRRHDTQPPYRISVSDCNGPLDLTGTIAEVSMWAIAKLKKTLNADDIFFALADNVGFQQCNVGDVILIDQVRNPEQMLITGFDETDRLIEVQRGYNGTTPNSYKKGQAIRIFRILNGVAETNIVKEDITNVDGTITYGVVAESQLIYNWTSQNTCMPGCYWLEFKLLKMLNFGDPLLNSLPLQNSLGFVSSISILPSVVANFVPSVSGCDLGSGVESVRRFPVFGEGFLVKINPSPSAENVF